MLPTSKSDDAKQPKQQQQPQKTTMTTTRHRQMRALWKQIYFQVLCNGNEYSNHFSCLPHSAIVLSVCPFVCRVCSCAPCCVVYSGRGLCLCYTLLRFCNFAFPFPVKSAIKSKSGPRDTARLLHFAVE